MNKSKNLPFVIVIGCVLLGALAVGLYTYAPTQFQPTTPDSAQLACGAYSIISEGNFAEDHTRNIQLDYNSCWTVNTYPGIQLVTAFVGLVVGDPALATTILAIGMYMLCVLLVMLILYEASGSRVVAGIGGLLALTSLSLVRSLLLTPHNLYGYAFTLGVFLIVVNYGKNKPQLALIATWLLTALTYFFHTMSFALLATSLTLFTAYHIIKNKNWLIGFGLFIVAGIGLYVITKSFNPLALLDHLQGYTVTGIIRPLIEHIALWGYTTVALSGIGIWLMRKYFPTVTTQLTLIYAVVCLFGTQLYLFNLHLLPDRMTAYMWIPLTITASCFILFSLQTFGKWKTIIVMSVVLLAQTGHALVFIKSEYNEISVRYQPTPQFIEAMQWLEDHRTKKTFVFTISNVINRQANYAGLYYHGDIVSYPWYRLNHKDISDLNSKDEIYKSFLKDHASDEYVQLNGMYNLINFPTSDATQKYIKKSKLTHVLLWKSESSYQIWQAAVVEYPVVFENSEYSIYKL